MDQAEIDHKRVSIRILIAQHLEQTKRLEGAIDAVTEMRNGLTDKLVGLNRDLINLHRDIAALYSEEGKI